MKNFAMTCIAMPALLSLPVAALAKGGEGGVGNGGHVIVCRSSEGRISSVELLDYYEARVARSQVIDLGATTLTPAEHRAVFLERVRRFDPVRADLLASAADWFFANAMFLPNTELEFIPDAENVIVQHGCWLEQLVVQAEPDGMSVIKRFTINKDLWDAMDATQRAGTVFHELIYREALALGQKNSVRARYFNSTVASTDALRFSRKDYEAAVAQAGLLAHEYRADGSIAVVHYVFAQPRTIGLPAAVQVWISRERFELDGTKALRLTHELRLQTTVGEITLDARRDWRSDGAWLVVSRSGALRAVIGGELAKPVEFKVGPFTYRTENADQLRFREDGTVDSEAVVAAYPELHAEMARAINNQKADSVPGLCPEGHVPVVWSNDAVRHESRSQPPMWGDLTCEISVDNKTWQSLESTLYSAFSHQLCVPPTATLAIATAPRGFLQKRARMSLTQNGHTLKLVEELNSIYQRGGFWGPARVSWFVHLPIPIQPAPGGRSGD